MSVRLALVLRQGGQHGYGREHVERLLRLVERYTPMLTLDPVLLTDVPGLGIPLISDWPTWWSKMELFRPDIDGDLFYLDLDVTPVADLSPLLTGVLTGIADKRSGINSSCMYLPAQYRARIWDRWIAYGPERAMRDYRGDQDFLYAQFPRRWRTFPKGQVVSYKRDVARNNGEVPAGALLVNFHGNPKPWSLP